MFAWQIWITVHVRSISRSSRQQQPDFLLMLFIVKVWTDAVSIQSLSTVEFSSYDKDVFFVSCFRLNLNIEQNREIMNIESVNKGPELRWWHSLDPLFSPLGNLCHSQASFLCCQDKKGKTLIEKYPWTNSKSLNSELSFIMYTWLQH